MDNSDLAAHDEETVEAIATLHAKHEREISKSQRLANRFVGYMCSDAALCSLTAFIAMWVAYNVIGGTSGHAFDRPPFSGLQTLLAATALYVTLIVLRTQRHEDQSARRRERLTLQLSIVADRKVAKVIALLEDMRRDSPFLSDRQDDEAHEMSRPSNPHVVLDALRKSDERSDEQTSG